MNLSDLMSGCAGTSYELQPKRRSDPRANFVANLRKQLDLFKGVVSPGMVLPRYRTDEDGEVILCARFANRPVQILPGEDAVHFPEDDFEVVLDAIIKAAENGDFDEQLLAISAAVAAKLQSGSKRKN